jgi:hypothetical protein
MLNKIKNLVIGVLSATIVVAVGASAYTAFASPDAAPATVPETSVDYGNGNGNGTGTSVSGIPASELSAEEAASLLYMREEEKLARDVYQALFSNWGQPTFQNIAASEQLHMDEIKFLIDRYALTDPALAPGQFTDPNLQALYDQLIAQGSLSLSDAFKVGAAIEEIDILDLQTRLAQTDNADIQLVYNNLMNGSYNHLQAFTSTLLNQTGGTYQPRYLPDDFYQTILTGTTGNGNRAMASGQGSKGAQAANGQANGNGGQSTTVPSTGSGIPQPQANIIAVTTVHGVVNSNDLTGLSMTTDDGQSLYIQLGNSRYSQSIGFAPTVGEGLMVTGFPGDLGLFSAITITVDSTGQTYTFRDELGRPLWTGGNGNGKGGNH